MPTAATTLDNLTKHLTQGEIEARAQAEADTLPDRLEGVQLKPPALMSGIPKAKAYWDTILKRMEGLAILDDLDSDTLGVYCVQLARYDAVVKDMKQDRAALAKARKEKSDEAEAIQGRIGAQEKLLQKLETTMLQYAEKLGLTPSGRVRLAQKRAAAAAAEIDPDGDLFGD